MAQVIDADVLVVGGGGAALRAAIEAQRAGARVSLAVKGQLGMSGFRGAGATASGTATDRHSFWPITASGEALEGALDDILQLGLGMADPSLARIIVEETPPSRRVLERLGVLFQPRLPVKSGGDDSCEPQPFRRTGVYLISPTLAVAVRCTDCQLHEHTMITGLLLRDGACVGAVGVDEQSGEVTAFRTGAVILGTGGAVQLFKHNVHPPCVTGDGYAVGYRAGAELMNLEYMQIFLGTPFPTINNVTNWVWAEKPRVYNALGEEFLERYLPPGASLAEAMAQAAQHSPFSTRDPLSRFINVALMKEVIAGRGSAHDGIYMDLTAPGVRVPEERDIWLRYRGIDVRRQPIEVVVYAMCFHGGLRIDGQAQTSVPQLYAVGECAAGPYGADRHFGNMMSSSQVFGARAGRHAARAAIASRRAPLPREGLAVEEARIAELRAAKGRRKPAELRQELQQAAWNHLLAVRTDAGVRRFLQSIREIHAEGLPDASAPGPRGLVESLEFQNLLLVGEMVGKAALMRTESRGSHYREDYPQRDDANWLKSIVIQKADDRMAFRTLALQPDWKDRPGDMHGERWG